MRQRLVKWLTWGAIELAVFRITVMATVLSEPANRAAVLLEFDLGAPR